MKKEKFEIFLIVIGLFILTFVVSHKISGDALMRYLFIDALVREGALIPTKYSSIGPFISIPLYLLGNIYKSSIWWLERFNVLLFSISLPVMYRLLRKYVNPEVVRAFFLIVISASMFPHHLQNYYGEVFTAVFVALGIVAVSQGKEIVGISMLILGALNTPASFIGIGLLLGIMMYQKKRMRYIFVFVLMILLHLGESWIRSGSFGGTLAYYNDDRGFKTLMPYSGKPGFSYPFLFGLFSMTLSFGKGVIFFAPGIIFYSRRLLKSLHKTVSASINHWMVFVVGLILVYSKWWSWYSAWFWGPRLLFFASIPASFLIALRLKKFSKSLIVNALVFVAFLLSSWVGINGVAFGIEKLEPICVSDNYNLEHLCWYTPEYSALWYPLHLYKRIHPRSMIYVTYSAFVFLYLSLPLLKEIYRSASGMLEKQIKRNLVMEKWKL
jgi:hypothetical protein